MESYGGSESSSSAMAPLSCHDFLERMRHPSAADLVKSIKSFIVSLSNKASDPDKDSASVQEFLSRMEQAFRSHSLWAGSSEEELDSAAEGLEKYLMTKIYSRAFASPPEDVKQDEELFEKIMLVQQFIRPENLEIKPTFQNETSWLLAQKELQKINMYKAPRDKLVCILNCCKVINNLLLNASISSSENPPGADEFLPVLIYVTIKANPPQLHSNLLYIQRYRQQSRLVSEAAYYFTNILSAESFIWNIDAKALSMDELEFQQSMESARAVLLGLSTDSVSHENQVSNATTGNKVDTSKTRSDTNDYVRGQNPDHQAYDLNDMGQKTTNRPSLVGIEKQGTSDLLKDEQPNRYFFDYPFLYARAGDLTVGEIDSLLNSYKQLVLKYVSLSKGMGVSNISPTVDTMQTETKLEASMNSEHIREMEMDNNSDGSLFMSKSEGNLLISLNEDKPKVPEDDSSSGQVAEKDEEFK